jgi:uncharacterized protein YkvS
LLLQTQASESSLQAQKLIEEKLRKEAEDARAAEHKT